MSPEKTKIDYLKSHYVPLILQFIRHEITAEEFQTQYMKLMQEDPYISPNKSIFDLLQAIFEDADAYDIEALPEDAPLLITEQELRECCLKNYERLQQLLSKY